MKKIYTFGHSLEYRNLTVADKIANKAAGIKMTQVTAQNAEEAAIIADQGVDMIITGSDSYQRYARVRQTRLSLPPCLPDALLPTMKSLKVRSRL